MDLIERLADSINSMNGLVMPIKKGFMGSGESFVIYPLPGSRTNTEFYDGIKEKTIIYEVGMKSKDQNSVHKTLWDVSNFLDGLKELKSHDGSFEYDSIVVSNEPYINQVDNQTFAVFLLTINVNVTVFDE